MVVGIGSFDAIRVFRGVGTIGGRVEHTAGCHGGCRFEKMSARPDSAVGIRERVVQEVLVQTPSLLNLSNPMSRVTLHNEWGAKVRNVGMCHENRTSVRRPSVTAGVLAQSRVPSPTVTADQVNDEPQRSGHLVQAVHMVSEQTGCGDNQALAVIQKRKFFGLSVEEIALAIVERHIRFD